jgi:aspartyl-tRNA(Asn)/glutamyl-tRNA(Gln) amidotransferase subunit B
MEIVSEADIRSPLEAAIYVSKLQTVLQHVGSSRALMEDGSIRCDVNISVRPYGSPKFGVRSEIKNLNSLKNVKQSCEAEIRRQILALSNGITLSQETRGFNVDRQTTFTLRRKETEVDYR